MAKRKLETAGLPEGVTVRVGRLEEFRPATVNPNIHTQRGMGMLEDAIGEVGYVAPVTVAADGEALDGSLRLEVVGDRMGDADPIVIEHTGDRPIIAIRKDVPNASTKTARRISLAANRVAEADLNWNAEVLIAIAQEDKELREGLWSEKEWAQVVAELAEGNPEDPDPKTDEAETLREELGVEPGQIWEIPSRNAPGKNHRIICADSTQPETYRTLMQGLLAHMVFTDPPYGVSYDAPSGLHTPIVADDLMGDDLSKFLSSAFKPAVRHTTPEAAFYIWHASATRDDFTYAMKKAGLVERQTIIWAKPNIILGWSDYRWSHEPCFYAAKDGQNPAFHGDRSQSTVWTISLSQNGKSATALATGLVVSDGECSLFLSPYPPKGKKVRTQRLKDGQSLLVSADDIGGTIWNVARDTDIHHPTQKPAELARRAIVNSSQPGEIVLDMFGGSGSTAIGAEQCGRVARLIELDPKYVAVTLQRMETLGLKPKCVGEEQKGARECKSK